MCLLVEFMEKDAHLCFNCVLSSGFLNGYKLWKTWTFCALKQWHLVTFRWTHWPIHRQIKFGSDQEYLWPAECSCQPGLLLTSLTLPFTPHSTWGKGPSSLAAWIRAGAQASRRAAGVGPINFCGDSTSVRPPPSRWQSSPSSPSSAFSPERWLCTHQTQMNALRRAVISSFFLLLWSAAHKFNNCLRVQQNNTTLL